MILRTTVETDLGPFTIFGQQSSQASLIPDCGRQARFDLIEFLDIMF